MPRFVCTNCNMVHYKNPLLVLGCVPEWQDKILHASLKIGDTVLMGSDAPPERYEKPKGFSVSLVLDDTGEAERIFKTLSEGGSVQMPIQQTFWAARFGMLTDRYAIPWMINCGQPG